MDLSKLPPMLLALVGLFGLAMGAIVWVLVANRQRQAVLRRTMTAGVSSAPIVSAIAPAPRRSPFEGLVNWLAARVPAQLGTDTVSTSRLVHAGFDGAAAASVYALLRVASFVLCTTLAFVLAPSGDQAIFWATIIIGISIGLLAPTVLLNGRAESRMKTIRQGIPDALDLLIVCVEAGVSLDAAIQRVGKELYRLHPLLSEELIGMTRRITAGMPREQALHGLYLRTGLDELRGLASHMLQSEKWGTSIATVLRLYSEQLRQKRRVAAEKRAATASTRMLIPLALFIFPTLFVILLGPAVIRISSQF